MKKSIKYFVLGLLLFIFSYENCFALSNVCEDVNVLKAFRIGGMLILIIKILAPVIIILTGIISFAKAVIAGDESEVKACTNILLTKVVVGVLIFSIPTFLFYVFNKVESSVKIRSEYVHCTICITNLKQCDDFIKKAT